MLLYQVPKCDGLFEKGTESEFPNRVCVADFHVKIYTFENKELMILRSSAT